MSIPTPEALEALLGKAAPVTALPSGYMHAAVLLPIYERDGAYHLVLTRRAYQLQTDGGVICFPGGGYESTDPDLTYTALRETFEEVGVAQQDVRVLGCLEPYFTRYGIAIHPVVGLIPASYPLQPQRGRGGRDHRGPPGPPLRPREHSQRGLDSTGRLVKRFTYVYEAVSFTALRPRCCRACWN